jgi:Tol biopolymer transport system component
MVSLSSRHLANQKIVKAGFWAVLLAALAFSGACQPQPSQVFIEVDGGRQTLVTEAGTVRQALAEAKITVGPQDRVKPDLYAQLEAGLVIVVTRVTEEIELKREIIPFERQTVTNEALAPGETRLAQLGVNGEDEISIRVVYENGVEMSRTELSRQIAIVPVPEILVVGSQGNLPSVPVAGTIAYVAGGNAWVMRDSSGSRRALTTDGKLDSRVFSLSPDGRFLLYTTTLPDDIDQPLNELWLASATIVGEQPLTLGLRGVLQAEWSPVISPTRLAYTTAERVPNAPGWKANNDLWLFTPPPVSATHPINSPAAAKPVRLLPLATAGLYPWWGGVFKWSPQGDRLAYARADQIGLVQLTADPVSATTTALVDFTPLKTFSEWVWVPGVSWSPDGKFLAAVVHGPPVASEPADESQVFDLWLFSADGELSAKVASQVGMWANPVWGPAGLAYGQAIAPLQSVNSRYAIQLIDRDGSNRRQLFPFQSEPGVQFPELAWSPSGDELLFVYNGNLYVTSRGSAPPKQLTTDGQAGQPRWVARSPVLSYTAGVTATSAMTGSKTITTYDTITPAVTPTVIPQLTVTHNGSAAPVTGTPPITNAVSVTPLPLSPTPAPATPVTPTRRPTVTPSDLISAN